jgi:PAS domain S-box-containing protein
MKGFLCDTNPIAIDYHSKKEVVKKILVVFFLSLLLLFSDFSCIAQTPSNSKISDSLLTLLKTSKEDTNKVNILNNLFTETLVQGADKALPYANQALKLSQLVSYKKGEAKALFNIGTFYKSTKNIDKALELYQKSLEIQQVLGDKTKEINTIIAIAGLYRMQLGYDKAMRSYLNALKLAEENTSSINADAQPDKFISSKEQEARLHYFIGNLYHNQENHPNALIHFLKALRIYTSTNNEKGIADVSLSIGIVYYDKSNTDKTQTFVFKGPHIEAMEYVTKAKKTYEKLHDDDGIVRADNHLAYISAGQNEYGLGLGYAMEALKISQKKQNKEMEISLYGTIGDIYHAQGNYKKALEYLNKCYEGAKAINNKYFMRDLYLSFSSIYYKLNDYQKAYEYHVLYSNARDAFINEESTKQIAEMSAKYDSEKKDKELIKKDAELIKKSAETTEQYIERNVLAGGIFLLFLVAIFSFRAYRNNEKAKIHITEQKEALESSYRNIAILGEIEKEIASSLSVEKIIEKVYENVNKLMSADIFCIGIHNPQNNSIDFPGFLEKGVKYNSSYDLNDNSRFPVICFKNGQEIFINDLDTEYKKFVSYVPKPIAGERPEAIIYLPLIHNKKTIGVINVSSFTKNAYTQYHLDILKNLAVYIAIALENAQLYENLEVKISERTAEVVKQKDEVERSYENTKLLSDISRQISALLTVEEIIQKVYENVNKLMDAAAFGIGIYKEKEKIIEFIGFIEKGEKFSPFSYELTDENRPAVWCFKKQQEIVINDIKKEYNNYFPDQTLPVPKTGEIPDSVLYIPLSIANKQIGVITVQSFKKNAYTPYQLDILRNLAVSVINALENARLYESMEDQVRFRTQEVIKQKEELEISYNETYVLSEIGQQITSTLDFEGIFNKLHESINKLMDAESFGVRIYDAATQMVDIKYEYDKGQKIKPFSFSIDNENNYTVWCIKNKKELFINDNAAEYHKYVKNIVITHGEMTHSLMFCPMILKGEVLGVITVQSYEKNKYTKHHQDILRSLANYTAIALENAQLYENLEEKVKERTEEVVKQKEEVEKSYLNTRLLSDIGREISSVLSVDEIMTKVYQNVNKLMDASVFGIGIINESSATLDCSGFIEKGEKLPFFQIATTEESRPAVWCFKKQQEFVINDLKKEYNNYFPDSKIPEPKEGEQAESIIYLPLSTQDKRIGVITVQSFKRNAYTQYQLDILRNLAVYVVSGLENARLYENMEEEVKARTLEIEKQNVELARLSIVASETDNGVLIFDANGEIEWVNEGFKRLQGYSLEELKLRGSTIEKISHSPQINGLMTDAIKNKKSSVYQALNITKEGKQLWVQSSLTPIIDEKGNVSRWVIIDIDVTDLKKAQDSIKAQNEKITDSINYAKRIQEMLLPAEDEVKKNLPESFILYKPKDIVSGDFYWVHKDAHQILVAAADCTGHGVPGAFMSLMGNNLLNDIVKVQGKQAPAEILEELNLQILNTLNQNSKNTSVKYGMDISLLRFEISTSAKDKNTGTPSLALTIQYAGAHSPLLIYRNNECIQIKANKRSIGSHQREDETSFTNHTVQLQKEDMIYMFSDGYADQIGGPENKKMFAQPFRDILQSISSMAITQQKRVLEETIEKWQGTQTQTDDILILGIRI